MPDISPSIPVTGQPNSSEEPKIVTALTQLVAAVNDVDSAQILDLAIATADIADAAVTDAKLASPNNSVWRTVLQAPLRIPGNQSFGLHLLVHGSSGPGLVANGVSADAVPPLWTESGFTVAGKTTEYRVAYRFGANGTAPGITLTFGLYRLTGYAGATGTAITFTASGTAVVSVDQTTASAGASYSGESAAVSGLFAAPTGYVLGVSLGSSMPANAMVAGAVLLQMRHT